MGDSEHGIALVLALLATALLSALGFAIVALTTTEVTISGSYRAARAALYAAEAALEQSLPRLETVDRWNDLLQGTAPPLFSDGAPGVRVLADGTSIDLGQVAAFANCGKPACTASDLTGNSTGDRPWGANNPVWRLAGHSPLAALLSGSAQDPPSYVVVLVADDPAETDGDPLVDGMDSSANPGSGRLAVRAEAFGPGRAHRVVEANVARESGEERAGGSNRLRVASWREVR